MAGDIVKRPVKTKQINGKRRYFYGKSKAEVRQKIERYNGIIGSAQMTVKDAMDAWLNEYVFGLTKATYAQYGALEHYITDIIGSIKVHKVFPVNCQDVLNNAAKHDLSDTTLRHIRKVMHAFFEHERIMRKTIKENPAHDLKLPAGKKTRERRAATPEELAEIWNRMQGTHYFYCFQFLLMTGLRPSEACGIKITDISGDTLRIREARTTRDVSTGKTMNANRTIALSPAVKMIINEQRKYLLSKKLSSARYLFPTLNGTASNSGYLTRAWLRLKKDTDITITLYELRHTFVSLAFDKIPMKELQALIGHSSTMDTSSTYAHIFKTNNDTAKIIDDAIAPYLPKLTTL